MDLGAWSGLPRRAKRCYNRQGVRNASLPIGPALARNNSLEVGTTMSDSTERPAAENNSPAPPLGSIPPVPVVGGREAEPDVSQSNQTAGAVPEAPADDPR